MKKWARHTPKKTLVLFIGATVVATALVLISGCSQADDDAGQPVSTSPIESAAPPDTAAELLAEVIAWVEAGPKRAETRQETPTSPPLYRDYGARGLPVLLHIETDPPFPGPFAFDSESYYLQVVKEGHELESRWIAVPADLMETEDGRKELGDLKDSIMWFWMFDPLTALRAALAEGELRPGTEAGSWAMKARMDPTRLAAAIPGSWTAREFEMVDNWTLDLEATAEGVVQTMTVNAQLDTATHISWRWSSAVEKPEIPDDALEFRDVLDRL
jgi:hypothetical protein